MKLRFDLIWPESVYFEHLMIQEQVSGFLSLEGWLGLIKRMNSGVILVRYPGSYENVFNLA